jgi:hypothetical protein
MKIGKTKGKQYAIRTQQMRTFATGMEAEVLP